MIASMTAFARIASDDWVWEVKSVNHRNLDLSFTLPAGLQNIEPDLRNLVKTHLNRGRIEGTLSQNHRDRHGDGLNKKVVERILNNIIEIRNIAHSSTRSIQEREFLERVDFIDILKVPGVLESSQIITDQSRNDICSVFETTLLNLIELRSVEGTSLAHLFRQRLSGIREILTKLDLVSASQISHIQEKLDQRIEKLAVEADPTRIAQEVALLAQRADVSEEIDRLRVHLTEFENCLNNDGPQGRRLGFIVQEMGRESNTLAAKLVPPDALTLSVDLKVLVDQIREQVQNVE